MPETPAPDFGDFQRDLDRALGGDADRLRGWWSDAVLGEAGLAVYRNTVARGCAEALAANFPTVERVTGQAWLRQAAGRFARAHPPARPVLHDYGAAFPAWLAAQAPELPYLADLARIDRLWREALFAPDAAVLAPEDFAGDLAGRVAEPHPSLRLARFDWNAPALWRLHQGPDTPELMAVDPAPAEVAILRPRDTVELLRLEPGGFAFLSACAAGRPPGAAATAAAAAGGQVAPLFSGLILAGAFTALRSAA